MARRVKNPATLAANVTENIVAISYGHEVFHLTTPVNLDTSIEGDLHIVEYPDLGILDYGRGETEALESFAETFSAMWHHLAEERDSNLDTSAKQIKRKMRHLVNRIEISK